MTPLFVNNWGKWQTYRKDRGTPPWIKIHRRIMSNPDWVVLSDAEKGQLVSIWIVAADKNGEIPGDQRILKKICLLDEEPDLPRFTELGFLTTFGCQDDATVTPSGCHNDAPEERRGEKRREEESGGADTTPSTKPKNKQAIPKGFTPSDEMMLWAEDKGVSGSVTIETEKFINHANANNRKQVDWEAAWRNWMLKSLEFNPQQKSQFAGAK